MTETPGETPVERRLRESPARKMASAMIAKIPLVLSRHVAASWRPDDAAIQRAQGRG